MIQRGLHRWVGRVFAHEGSIAAFVAAAKVWLINVMKKKIHNAKLARALMHERRLKMSA